MEKKETMLGRIIPILNQVPTEMLGTLLDLLNRLVGEKGQETCKNLKHLLRGEFEIKLPSLIRWLGTTTTSATTEKFVAKEKFRTDSKEVKFYGFGDNFTNWFLSGDSKIEDSLDEQSFRYGNLIKNSVDGPILEELGDEAKVKTALSGVFELLKRQANGEEGDLLTNGYANIFYIKNTSGVLCIVRMYWCGVGWRVNVNSVEDPGDWHAGDRVFSRAA